MDLKEILDAILPSFKLSLDLLIDMYEGLSHQLAEMGERMKALEKENQILKLVIRAPENSVKQSSWRNALEQYGRHECLEIQGLPTTKDEKTTDLVIGDLTMSSGKGYDNKEDHTEDSKPQIKPEDVEMASSSDEGEGSEFLSHDQRRKLIAELDNEKGAMNCWIHVAEILLEEETVANIDYMRDTGRATDHFFIKLSQSHISLTLEQFSNAAVKLHRSDIKELISEIIEDKMNTKRSELKKMEERVKTKLLEREIGEEREKIKLLELEIIEEREKIKLLEREIIEERKKIKLSDLDLLQRRQICHLVSHCAGNPDGGWLGFAAELGLSDDAVSSCSVQGGRADRNYSPTREMLRAIGARYTTEALSKLTEALEKLRREDLLKIIKKRPEQSHSC